MGKRMDWGFLRAVQYLGSISLGVGEIQINTTQSGHPTSNRWAQTQLFNHTLC